VRPHGLDGDHVVKMYALARLFESDQKKEAKRMSSDDGRL
jgi:hypothetical protein